MKKKYPEIVIKQGMEFGMQMHTINLYQKLFNRYSFDFIILSCHQVEDKEFWTQDFQRGRTQQEYNERYYKEILDVTPDFNIQIKDKFGNDYNQCNMKITCLYRGHNYKGHNVGITYRTEENNYLYEGAFLDYEP